MRKERETAEREREFIIIRDRKTPNTHKEPGDQKENKKQED